MTDELKPCPFCGWKAEIKGPDGDTGGMWEISCPNTCRALVVAERRDWAVRRWNTRPVEDELRADATLWRDHVGQRQAMHYTWAIMEDEAKTFFGDVADLRAKWDAIPWGVLSQAAQSALGGGWEEYGRLEDDALEELFTWLDANAPKEATKGNG